MSGAGSSASTPRVSARTSVSDIDETLAPDHSNEGRAAGLAGRLSAGMPAATARRRLLFATAIVCYAVVFASFVLFEKPGLGLGHFFYIPVALIALACGTQVGFLGGSMAAALYALAIVLTPRLP